MTFVTKTNLHSRSDLFIHRLPIRSIVEAIEFDGDAGDAGDVIGRRVPATLHVARHSGPLGRIFVAMPGGGPLAASMPTGPTPWQSQILIGFTFSG